MKRLDVPKLSRLGLAHIEGQRFKFNNVADVVPHDGKRYKNAPCSCYGKSHLLVRKILIDSRGFQVVYRKEFVTFRGTKGRAEYNRVCIYKMNYTGFHTPKSNHTSDGIRNGLERFLGCWLPWETLIDHSIDSAIIESFRESEEAGSPFTNKRIGGKQWA